MRTRMLVRLEAAIFDMDGVLTLTARLHFASWKRLFDELFARPDLRTGDRRPFGEDDYLAYVDGRPRLDGIRALLASRGIALSDTAVDALGRRKETFFLEELARAGVEVDPSAIGLVRAVRDAGVRVGVASSSRNAEAILRRAGIDGLFDARLDGVRAAAAGLRGKPSPDLFLACLRLLGRADPSRALVVEDAAAGIAAARAGGFGLAIGVDRGGNRRRLEEAGADRVVTDLAELSLAEIDRHFRSADSSAGDTRTT